jgi:hypothetical protein
MYKRIGELIRAVCVAPGAKNKAATTYAATAIIKTRFIEVKGKSYTDKYGGKC